MQRDFHQTGGDCFPSIFFSIVVSDLLRHNLSDKNAILLNPPFFFAGPVDLKYFLPYYLTYIYIYSFAPFNKTSFLDFLNFSGMPGKS